MSKPLEYLNQTGCCPDCGNPTFIMGPEGGSAVNIKCANGACGSKFWFAPPFTPERINNDDQFYRRAPVVLLNEFPTVFPQLAFVPPKLGWLARLVEWLS